MSIGQEIPDPDLSESARLSPPDKEPPLTKERAVSNEYYVEDEENVARKLHDNSVFSVAPNGLPWEKVDPVYRQRRLFQAHDLVTLGYVQKINYFFGYEDFEKALKD